MFCPRCRSEYREGFTRCESCDVPLVAVLPPEAGDPSHRDLVTVFETGDPGLLAMAHSGHPVGWTDVGGLVLVGTLAAVATPPVAGGGFVMLGFVVQQALIGGPPADDYGAAVAALFGAAELGPTAPA